jgi:hypothetical protein
MNTGGFNVEHGHQPIADVDGKIKERKRKPLAAKSDNSFFVTVQSGKEFPDINKL